MKRFALAALSVLLTSTAVVPAVNAQVTSAAPPANASAIGMAVTPFNLVFLAYQGFFESEGIPKFSNLATAYKTGRVTAKDLVKVAVDMRRLPSKSLGDQAYLNAVEYQLMTLQTGN